MQPPKSNQFARVEASFQTVSEFDVVIKPEEYKDYHITATDIHLVWKNQTSISWVNGDRIKITVRYIPGWIPMAYAPKDNKRPLYIAQFNEQGKLVDIDFNASFEYWQESYELPDINGWYWASEYGQIEEPTHWAYQE